MTICERIAAWAATLEPDAIPAPVRERAELQRRNLAAAAAAGAREAAPFAAAAPAGSAGAVYRNAAASIAHDWDDYLFMGHTGHSAVWAADAFAEGDGARLVAQVAANEVAGRLGAALFVGPHNGQFWSAIHCAGGAVAAGLGLRLDRERLAHAVAISLYQPPYGLWPGFMGPPTKLLTAAEPAMQGARAALLAAEGVEGPLDVIESPRGLVAHFAFAGQPSMLGGFGGVWLTDTLAYKPYPGCAYLQAAVDAALAADLAARDVAAIEVEAGYLTCGMESLGAGPDLSAVRVNFSAALSVAVALVGGRLTHRELAPEWLAAHETEVRELAARVRVRHDWDATAAMLRGTIEAGASLAGIPPAAWPRVRRRMRELGMDEISLGWAELRELLGEPRARRELGALLRRALRGPDEGLQRLDTERLRLSFPCRLRIRLRSGRTLEVEGRERGACGAPLAEQREVVFEKAELTAAAAVG